MKRPLAAIGLPAGIIAGYALLSLLWVSPSLVGRTDMVPWDALNAYTPWTESQAVPNVKPHNALITDSLFQNMAWQHLNREAFKRGRRVRWNPGILCGQPVRSGLLYGYRYPLDVFRRRRDPGRAAAWMFAVHLALGASFCALLARRFGAGGPGSALAGVVYACSAPVLFNMTFHTMQGTLAWLPGCALAMKGLLDATERPAILPRLGWTAGVVAAHSMSMLSGHPEITLYTFIVSGALAAWTLASRWSSGLRTAAGAPLAALLLAAMAGGGIIRPELEALRNNFRTDALAPGAVRSHGLPAYQLAGFLIPDFGGSPVHHRFFDPFEGRVRAPDRYAERGPVDWGDRNAVEGAVYVGILPLLLLGCAGGTRLSTRFLWIGLAAGGLLAFGTPLYTAVYYGIPFARQLRTPVRWMIPAALCLSVLAGIGLEQAHTGGRETRLRRIGAAGLWLAAGMAGLALAALVFRPLALRVAAALYAGAGRVQESFSGPAEFLAFSAGRLLKAAGWMAVSAGAALWLARSKRIRAWAWLAPALAAADLAAHHGSFFTHATDDPVRSPPPALRALQAQPGRFRITAFGGGAILPPNTALRFGLEDLRGYESVMDRRMIEFLTRLEPQPDLVYNQAGRLRRMETLESPWMDFLNVEFILSQTELSAHGWDLFFEQGARIYRNREVLPRYYVSRARPDAFDHGPPPPSPGSSAQVAAYEPDRVALDVYTPEPAWLVSSDTDLGFWQPWVDGRPADSNPLLGLFRCVRLPAGSHRVEWRLGTP